MKWPVLAALLVIAAVAGVYVYAVSEHERAYRQHIDTGEAALAQDDAQAAIDAFGDAIAMKPESMLGYLKRGEAHARRGEYEPALRDLRRAVERDATAPRAQELLGDVYYALRRYDRAAQRYEAYLRLDDGAARMFYKLGLAHYAAGQPAPAIAALRRAVGLDNKFAEAQYLLGLCLRELHDARRALTAVERAVAIAPALLQAREELADLYANLGRQRDRIKQLEALHALDPGPDREVALGLAYADAGRLESAVLRLGEAAERYSDHAETYAALGRVWLQTAQRDALDASRRVSLSKALSALEQSVSIESSSSAATLYGRALLMTGENDQLAEQVLQEATERFPVDPSSFFYLAEAAERCGHLEVARRALVDYHALDINRNGRRTQEAAQRIAELSLQLNDSRIAVRWYRRAIDISSNVDATFLTGFAEALLRSGDLVEARATLDRALQKDPNSSAARALRRRLAVQ